MLHTTTFSAPGGHIQNEDAFVLCELADAPECWFACIADGQGGRAGGAKAAQLACEVCAEHATRVNTNWLKILAIADATVASNTEAGFTTLAGFTGRENIITGASCGDSAVVAFSANGEPNVLTTRQYKNPPVGSGEAAFVPFSLNLTTPWKILAVTDGVWKYVGWHRVFEIAAKFAGNELITQLQNAAKLPRTGEFPDDFTVVLLECE